MKYNGKAIEDLSDGELDEAIAYNRILIAERENRLLDKTKRHKNFNFDNINPAFVQQQKEIETELALRKARG